MPNSTVTVENYRIAPLKPVVSAEAAALRLPRVRPVSAAHRNARTTWRGIAA